MSKGKSQKSVYLPRSTYIRGRRGHAIYVIHLPGGDVELWVYDKKVFAYPLLSKAAQAKLRNSLTPARKRSDNRKKGK